MSRTRVLWVLALVLAVAGCAGGGGLPVTHYYTLGPPAEGSASQNGDADGVSIGVGSIVVDSPYDQDRLVFRKGRDGNEVGFYAYHRWASPLGRMVAVALADALEGADGIATVEPARSGGDYWARLEGRLLYLEQIDAPSGQEVRAGLELKLRMPDGKVWSMTGSASAPGSASEVPEVVELARQAFDILLAQARSGLETALAEHAR